MRTLIVVALLASACVSPTDPTRVHASEMPSRAVPGIGDGALPRVPAVIEVDSSWSSIPTPVAKTPPTAGAGTQPVGRP